MRKSFSSPLGWQCWLAFASVLITLGCQSGADAGPAARPGTAPDAGVLDSLLFPDRGATTFETAKAEEASAASNSGVTGDTASENAGAASGAAAPAGVATLAPSAPAPTTTTTPAAQQPSAMREIVEADIVQAKGDILYALNRYRGLLLIDMSVPDSPIVVGRVPFQAQPVDMYLRDDKAYVVMSDYFSYWQFDSDADPLGFHGSQVLVVDVKDPAHPQPDGSFNVDGEVTDTRIVGDVLYTVSKRNPDYWRYDTQDWHDTTWVMSIDLSDPLHIKAVDKQEFPGAANLIQVYDTALSIAATDPNYYLVDTGNQRQTLITYVDISDPKGAIKVGGTGYVPGAVADKFKMDLQAGQLRVMSDDWYWRPNAAAQLTLFDASNPSKLVQRAQIDITNDTGSAASYAQVQATRFDGPNLFVNLCWWTQSSSQQNCRIDFYDLSTADKAAKVKSLVVDGPVTHFDTRPNRLLSLGSHTFYAQPSSVQIALFDVTNLKTAKRLSVVDLGAQGGTGSAALSDYKAFKVLDTLGMILLPLTWSDNLNGVYTYHQGAQIVNFQNDQLTARGRVQQNGNVERAIAFKNRVVSISTEQIQVIDASNRDKPVATANLFLVRNVVDVFSIGGYQVQLGVDEEDSSYRFFVLPFGEDDMAKSVAELPVDTSLFYQMQDGAIVHMIGNDRTTGDQLIRNADFSDPKHPRWRGEYRIPAETDHFYSGGYSGYWSFYDYYWNPNAGQPLDNRLLPVTTRVVNADTNGRRYYKNYLRVIDLRNADKPRLAAGSIEMPDWPFINHVGHGTMLYSTHTEPALDAKGNPKKYHERYFLDRIDASDPDHLKALPKVNIPGRLIDVDASGKVLYTVDYQWDDFGRRRNSFDVLKLDANTATLETVLPVGDEIDRGRYLDREVWLSTHRYAWWGLNSDSPDSRQPYTRLTRLRFSAQAALTSQDSHDVAGYDFDLLDVEGARVYLASSYPTGLLILDTTDFAKPSVLGASRTIGYVSKIVRDGAYLYMPMGSYGVRRVKAP
ncbi:MAG TPA: beta-propeller domain-containing protein [Polyangiales bacterium]